MNVAHKMNKEKLVKGTQGHETDPKLSSPPKHRLFEKASKDVPHLIKEDLAEWEYDADRPKIDRDGVDRGTRDSRFPPIDQRQLHGRATQ